MLIAKNLLTREASYKVFGTHRLGTEGGFAPAGIVRQHWSGASPVRTIFRKTLKGAGLPYFPPHFFRQALGHLAQTCCRKLRN